jgi:hypothetical protein
MGFVIGFSVNDSIPTISLSNYLGDFSSIETILQLPKVPGNYADLKRFEASDIQYYYDAGDSEWKPRSNDFKGYYTSLEDLRNDNPDPIITFLATNINDRTINYIVFNGDWIEEPTTLNAAYIETTINNRIDYLTLSRVTPQNKIITQIDIEEIIPKKTSQIINDGQNGDFPYVDINDIEIGNMSLLFQNNLQ